jgi:hypothetical protein
MKRQVAQDNQAAHAEMDGRAQRPAAPASEGAPSFPTADQDSTGLITQRHWSDPPTAALSVLWRPWTRGEDGVPFWLGKSVDPLTYEPIDVSRDEAEAERRQAVSFAVAGTHLRLEVLARAEFNAGQRVALVPDPRNAYDPQAIEVRDAAGQRTVGFVPQDRSEESFDLHGEIIAEHDATFAQRLLHGWLARGPVAALIISERSWFEDGEPTSRRGGITVLAGPHLECVEVPARGDDDYAEFTAARLKVKAEAWPRRRTELRREIDAASDAEDRHFLIDVLVREAYRLRDAHPEALDDATAACREQIELAPRVATVMRQRYGRPLPAHVGFKQLAIILEKQKDYTQAVEVVEQARAQGWDGDWDKRLERLKRRQP